MPSLDCVDANHPRVLRPLVRFVWRGVEFRRLRRTLRLFREVPNLFKRSRARLSAVRETPQPGDIGAMGNFPSSATGGCGGAIISPTAGSGYTGTGGVVAIAAGTTTASDNVGGG